MLYFSSIIKSIKNLELSQDFTLCLEFRFAHSQNLKYTEILSEERERYRDNCVNALTDGIKILKGIYQHG